MYYLYDSYVFVFFITASQAYTLSAHTDHYIQAQQTQPQVIESVSESVSILGSIIEILVILLYVALIAFLIASTRFLVFGRKHFLKNKDRIIQLESDVLKLQEKLNGRL